MIDWTNRLDNFNERVRFLVLHHTVANSAETTINAFKRRGVSSHYIVDKDATIYKMVDDHKRAWHAGVSDWGNSSNINDTSIGIEIVNLGDKPFLDPQLDGVAELSKEIIKKYKIKNKNIVAHGDIAFNRKYDPSAYFDWKLFYKKYGLLMAYMIVSLFLRSKKKCY